MNFKISKICTVDFSWAVTFSSVNNRMKPVEYFGQRYTQFFAWLPRRMSSGHWVWLDPYFIRPNRNGTGIILSFEEVRLEHLDLPK